MLDDTCLKAGKGSLYFLSAERVALSQRADQRLDRFMPELLDRIDQRAPDDTVLNRIFDLVLAISRRSAYLVLLVHHPKALDRMLDLFERSEWVADKVIRFPALLDELIDPSLGAHIPSSGDLFTSVGRILSTAPDAEAVLEALNYLKLATELRIAIGQLQQGLSGTVAQSALSDLASALLHVLSSARLYPRVIRATGTSAQVSELEAIGWLSPEDARVLVDTEEDLRQHKMMAVLEKNPGPPVTDTRRSARICAEKLRVDGHA